MHKTIVMYKWKERKILRILAQESWETEFRLERYELLKF
jgi:hypothetical protein